MLEDVVDVELVECEEGCVLGRVDEDGLLPHDGREGSIEAHALSEGRDGIFEGDVAATAGEVAVVGECIKTGAWSTHWKIVVSLGTYTGGYYYVFTHYRWPLAPAMGSLDLR